ncbi:MAG: hypothetical protein [Bacteriophage sp.]|jgi:hypothetical protein|uniref:TRC8 N-terminal domain n=1 Tax=Myoviridae sp. ctNQV2 TaxID=2827683 RepID=A0A8S5RYK2_9CAUD|nr:MAG: hypothetical protein [Bacteriophage sp.]DAF43805.1 MAG TPA: TRC8 N-terminal domain [Myoviridae sp. ctNQV2]
MIPIEVLQYTIILYAISFIIVIAGFYVDFEGETLEEFKTYLFYRRYGDDCSNFFIAIIPMLNVMVAIIFSIIGIYRLIILPFKMINESFNIWNRIKNLKIKKRK